MPKRALRNVTITLDEQTANWARIEAAHRDTSVSQLVAALLREHMRHDQSYEAAMDRFLAARPRALKRRGSYPARDAVHGRHRLR